MNGDSLKRTNAFNTDEASKRVKSTANTDDTSCAEDHSENSLSDVERVALNESEFGSCLKGNKIKFGCSFRQTLNGNYAFIDKSMFIEAVLSCSSRSSLITAPRRMGKTFNLGILREFFSPCDKYGQPMNTADRLKGLKIMNKSISSDIKNYMGKHAVVYVNLDRKSDIHSVEDVKSCFEDAVYESHEDHRYLIGTNNEIVNIAGKWMFDPKLNTSLKSLTSRLYEHHKSTCVFLVDGYDTLLTQLAKACFNSKDEKEEETKREILRNASDFLLGALDMTIKGNDNVEIAVLTGISDVAVSRDSGPLNDIARYMFLRSFEFSKYFGFMENEYNEIIERFKKDDIRLVEAKKLYNGYRFIDDQIKFSIYNPWAAFKFASTPKSAPPPLAWCETGTIAATTNVCKVKSVRETMLNLIAGESFKFKPVKRITYTDLITLAEMCESSLFNESTETDLYYTHLLNQGYLTIIENDEPYVLCEIPNYEVRQEFLTFITKHVGNEYGVDLSQVVACSKIILELLKSLKNNRTTELESLLKELHKKLKLIYSIDETKTNLNEFVLNCVSFVIGNELNRNKDCQVFTQYYCNDGINKGYLDVAYSYENCVIIVENKLKDSIDTAIKQIISRNYRSRYPLYEYILVGTTLDYSFSKENKLGYLINTEDLNRVDRFE